MKRNTILRVMVLTIIGCLLVMTVACTSQNSTTAQTTTAATTGATTKASETTSADIDIFAKYSPEITMTVGWGETPDRKYGEGEDMMNNRWTKKLKDELGIKVVYDWVVADAQYGEKVNIIIATGDIPDVMRVSSVQLAKLVDADLVNGDLQDVFDQYVSPTQLIDYNNAGREETFGAATFNGKLAAIPYAFSATGQGTQCLNIRTDWMKKLDLDGPETFDDLLAIMEAFSKQDFDGNGIDDSIGLVVSNNLSGLNPLFWCFHAYPNAWIKDSTGKIVYGSAMPEIKTALTAFADMYKKGYIDKEFAAKDWGKAAELLSSSRSGINVALCHDGAASNMIQENKEADFGSYLLPSADGQPVMNYFPSFGDTFYAIKKEFANPEAVVKMFSFLCEQAYGADATYEYYQEYIQDIDSGLAPFTWGPWFNVSVEKNYRTYKKFVANVPYEEMNGEERWIYDQVTAFNEGKRESWWMARFFEPGATCHYAVLDQVLNNDHIILDAFYGAPLPSMVQNKATIDKVFIEMCTKIIMGEDSIDQFDAYVERMNSAGLADMTQEVNNWANQR